MKSKGRWALAATVAAGIVGSVVAQAPPPGIERRNLLREDLSAPGREAIQVLVGFAPGASFPAHSHPGEEIVFVTEGSLVYELAGKAPVTLRAGDVLFIPAGTVHAVRNTGDGHGAELATYIVEKGSPLITLATKDPKESP
jgi:quercetin dioxygenase-like cupin family protein